MSWKPDQPPRWRAALLDLDGTLVDTRPGVRAALAAAFAEVSGDDAAAKRVDLSLPLDQLIRSADPASSPFLQLQLSAAFRRHYDSSHWMSAQVCPGAEEALRDLRAAGVRAFVVTNKRTSAAERILEHFHLAQNREAGGGQTEAPLPKSELVGRCLKSAALDPATTVVVGDSDQDAEAAASWSMVFIAVTSGTGPLSHVSGDEKRVEVASLADAMAFVLEGARGR